MSSTSNTLRLDAEEDGSDKNIIKLLVLLLQHVIDFWSLYSVISVVLSKLDFFRSVSFWRGWYSCKTWFIGHYNRIKNLPSFIWKEPFDSGWMKSWSKSPALLALSCETDHLVRLDISFCRLHSFRCFKILNLIFNSNFFYQTDFTSSVKYKLLTSRCCFHRIKSEITRHK